MPDYELRFWSLNDIKSSTEPYLQTALAHGRYANAANLLRFTILRDHGGTYLDTDIETIKRFDHLLNNECFAGEQRKGDVNNAVLGSIKDGPFVTRAAEALVKEFDGLEAACASSPEFMNRLIQNDASGITIYPTDWFYPYFYQTEFRPECITQNTVCIHHWAKRW